MYKIANNDLLYGTGKYTRSFIIAFKGKEYEKKIYIYESLRCTAETDTTL